MILPGSSPEASSSCVPWRRASVRSVPSAKPVPSGSIIRAAQMLSRPNRVRNHGTPAAMKASLGPWTARPGVETPGRRGPGRRGGRSADRPPRCSACAQSTGVRAASSSGARSPTRADQRSVTSSSVRSSTGQAAWRCPDRASPARRSRSRSRRRRPRPTIAAAGFGQPGLGATGIGRTAVAGRVRPARAHSMGVRSQARRTATVSRTGAVALDRTRMVSSIPSGRTLRVRSSRTVGSGIGSPSDAVCRRTWSRRARCDANPVRRCRRRRRRSWPAAALAYRQT